jgi:hypothetical protein
MLKQRAPFTRSEGWTIEDEQCQKIGGGYKAVKFRFLLFLWMEPTFYLRRSRVQRHESWEERSVTRKVALQSRINAPKSVRASALVEASPGCIFPQPASSNVRRGRRHVCCIDCQLLPSSRTLMGYALFWQNCAVWTSGTVLSNLCWIDWGDAQWLRRALPRPH